MTTPRRPSIDDLSLAADWFDVYEGAEDAEACQRVRAWLLRLIDDAQFRVACKQVGVPVAAARAAICKATGEAK